jgi:hypothetical protein
MQGSFPVGVDWTATLDPAPDDEIQYKVRSDIIERELQRVARSRDPAAAAQPDPLAYVGGPYAPTPFFRVGLDLYFILKHGMEKTPPREGIWGHYLVATVTFRAVPGQPELLSRPFLDPQQIPQAEQVPNDDNAPGMQQRDERAIPYIGMCKAGRDFIKATNPASYQEIGLEVLKQTLEEAEALDLAFARRMEGLGNVASNVCWDCLDPDYDPSDRPAVMAQFMGKYLDRFYNGIDPENGPPTSAVADEALQKHKAFCQAWVRRHYKTLTPTITGPAEAIASDYYPYMENLFPPNARLTRAELARVLMRHEETAAEFATCLHFYNTSLEQTRGGRNASYKQMSVTSMSRAASHRRMGDLLGSKTALLRRIFLELSQPHKRNLHVLIVDWHSILGQMPHVHRYFENSTVLQGLIKRARRQGPDPAYVPPWRIR